MPVKCPHCGKEFVMAREKLSEKQLLSAVDEHLKVFSTNTINIINKCFSLFATTRKSKKIGNSVKLKFLESIEKYSEEDIANGLSIYITKELNKRFYDERYALGIIRNNKKFTEQKNREQEDKIGKLPPMIRE